ncbi:MAG TPA: aromatic ring-hydroxylating dioxygenase subunit alpha [Myxococcota bacterium]|nr:aromatic ring-hydroxylating dioxygenase subunit alpha [Myxococcota bacterium]
MSFKPPRPSYQELLDTDSRPVPALLREVRGADFGTRGVPVERYVSRAFHELEVEKLWKRVWQMACREEDLAAVGDYAVYEIASLSALVVRAAPGEIRAFANACLHRGRLLKERDGRCTELRCPFHGFTWSLGGKLVSLPTPWDFPHVDREKLALPELRVGTWGGFVFVNFDPACAPLAEHLAGLDAQFARWPLERRYKQAHVAKRLRANWKVAQEAFMEALHVGATHPQLAPGLGDTNSQYDAYENFSRAITPNGTPSPELARRPAEQAVLDAVTGRREGAPGTPLPEGASARAVLAAGMREALRPVCGSREVDALCDAELVDSFYYTVFPNFHPWGAYNRIAYRFRPDGDAHERSIMEVMMLAPFSGERPPSAPVHWLGDDEPWTAAPELGPLARIFEQDGGNIPQVQRGLHALRGPELTLSSAQEAKLRHFHALLDKWINT